MRKRVIVKILWYAFSIVLFWNLLIAVRAWRFTHFSDLEMVNTRQINKAGFFSHIYERFTGRRYYKTVNTEKPAFPFTVVNLSTNDHLNIECWHIPAEQPRGTVILFHGLQGSKQNMLPEAGEFRQMGYSTLLVDFRAHGGSDGHRCTLGVNETEEVKMAYAYLQQHGEKNIILYGASMGAATVMHALSRYEELQPAKVVLDMPFVSYEKLVEKWFSKSKYPTQPGAKLFTFWAGVLNGEWFFNLKTTRYGEDIHCPVLMQWGRNDNLVSEKDTHKIFDNIASAQKQLVVYDQCGHESYCVKEKQKWQSALCNFLQ